VGIIYCLSRKSTEELAVKLLSNNIKAAAYHAHVPPKERSQVQEDFINDKIQVVCATVAFGMGIDKSNVRWVIHYNLPKNIESYYQEIGRAGRDGAPADTILFYSIQDVNVYRDMFAESGGGNTDVQNAKLDRMQQFADAQICRRTILLNYFNEHHEGNCGNCDVCDSPPQYFDGTTVAQMALSAVTRLQGEANMSLLIDVLRGSGRHEIIEKGFDKIKTYGIGRNIPQFEWQSYLWQIIQLGLLDIAYDDKHKLKLTPASNDTLFKNKEVKLLKPLSIKEREDIKRKVVEAKTKTDVPRMRIRNELFDFLREFRRNLALEKGVPPYLIFSDATLGEMSAIVPQDEASFRSISGVGEQKWQQFGELFLSKIEAFLSQNPQFVESGAVNQVAPKVPREPALPKERETKIHTTQITYDMFLKGMSLEDIAEQRFLSVFTISSHLIQFYEQGAITDIYQFVTAEEIQTINEALDIFPEPYKLREIFEYYSENFAYDKIRWAIAYREKHKEKV
jgi:ATP-dependent DNA helicase RecQ